MNATDPAARARRVFPGASLGEYDLPAGLSRVLTSGQGAKVTDTEGREFVDYTMGWGSVLLGHAHPSVVEAVTARVARGANFAYVNDAALELAEELTRAVACAEKVRFCASGTEATMYAVRFARAFTRRNKLIKFEGAYHGANEFGAISLFPKRLLDFPTPEPTSAGLTKATLADTLIAPYNDLDTVTRIAQEHADDLAAIIVEPLHRNTPPKPGFLEGLRELTHRLGAILIFDEVVTGFRLAYGGGQAYYGVTPDLAALGKGLGGGFPIGAIVGRGDILDLCDEATLGGDRYVWFASSIGGNPISTTSALATLRELRRPGTYERFFALGEALRAGLRDIVAELGIAAQVLGDGPLCALAFTTEPVVDYRASFRADKKKSRAFLLGLVEEGIFLNPMSTKLYLSLAHENADVARLHEAARIVLKGLANASQTT